MNLSREVNFLERGKAMAWLLSNIWTILISLFLILVVTFIIIKMVRDKKKGRSSCGCDCGCCSMKGTCHKSK